MALVGGSVTVNNDQSYSGSGLALAIFEARRAWLIANVFPDWDPNGSPPSDVYTPATWAATANATRLAMLHGAADFANLLAPPIVDHIKANAEVTVTVSTSDGGLQRTPDPNDPNTNTQAPSANKVLATKGTIA